MENSEHGPVLKVLPGKTYLGIHPADQGYAADNFVLWSPYVQVDCPAFACDAFPVSLNSFLDWFETAIHGFRSAVRDNDRRYWGELGKRRRPKDALALGVTLEEAMAFAWSRGGRLLFETEWLRLARGDQDKPTSELFPNSWTRPALQGRRRLPEVSEPSWIGAERMLAFADELTLTAFTDPTGTYQKSFPNYGRVGKDVVLMQTGAGHEHRILGLRGCYRPYFVVGTEDSPWSMTARTPGLGFRVAYDWDTDAVEFAKLEQAGED